MRNQHLTILYYRPIGYRSILLLEWGKREKSVARSWTTSQFNPVQLVCMCTCFNAHSIELDHEYHHEQEAVAAILQSWPHTSRVTQANNQYPPLEVASSIDLRIQRRLSFVHSRSTAPLPSTITCWRTSYQARGKLCCSMDSWLCVSLQHW